MYVCGVMQVFERRKMDTSKPFILRVNEQRVNEFKAADNKSYNISKLVNGLAALFQFDSNCYVRF